MLHKCALSTARSCRPPRAFTRGLAARTLPVLTRRPHPAQAVERATDKPETEEDRVLKARSEATRRIKTLGEKGKMKEAIQELANLAQLGVQPDTLAATTLVKACCRDMELAQSIFEELFGDFLEPDEVTFAVLLRGYGAKVPPDWTKIDATLTTMRTRYELEPSSVCYNALLEICSRTNDLDRGQDIIDRMEADGVDPDVFTEEIVAKRRVLRSYLKKIFG